jgi:hypothetical protein
MILCLYFDTYIAGLQSYFEQFTALCRSDFKQIVLESEASILDIRSNNESISQIKVDKHSLTQFKEVFEFIDTLPKIPGDDNTNDDCGVEVYVVPAFLQKWPIFHESFKQINVYGSDVLSLRCDSISVRRRKEIIDCIIKRRSCFVYGTPGIGIFNLYLLLLILIGYIFIGIGKSVESTYVLMQVIKHLGENGYPKTLFYRLAGTCLVRFDHDPNGSASGVKVQVFGKYNLDAMSTLYCDSDGYVIMDLTEDESDPKLTMPGYVTTSSRLADEVWKTMEKAGELWTYLSEPPSIVDLLYQTFSICKFTNLPNNYIFEGNSIINNIRRIYNRSLIVGPIPRRVYQSSAIFKKFLENLNLMGSAETFKDLKELTLYNVPGKVKFVASPYYKRETFDNTSSLMLAPFEYRFLSHFSAMKIASLVREDNNILLLRELGLDWQIAERAILHGLMNRPVDFGYNVTFDANPFWGRSNWVLFEDPGHENPIQNAYADSKELVNKIPYITKQVYFQNMYYKCEDITTLDQEAAYIPLVHNFPICEFFTVDHDNKKLNLFQSTSLDLKDHSFSVERFKESIFDNFKLHDSEYSVVLYLCIPNNFPVQFGSAFTLKGLESKKTIQINKKDVLFSLEEIKRIARGNKDIISKKMIEKGAAVDGSERNCEDCTHMLKVSTVIIRFPYYPQWSHVEPAKKESKTSKKKSKKSETEVKKSAKKSK